MDNLENRICNLESLAIETSDNVIILSESLTLALNVGAYQSKRINILEKQMEKIKMELQLKSLTN